MVYENEDQIKNIKIDKDLFDKKNQLIQLGGFIKIYRRKVWNILFTRQLMDFVSLDDFVPKKIPNFNEILFLMGSCYWNFFLLIAHLYHIKLIIWKNVS